MKKIGRRQTFKLRTLAFVANELLDDPVVDVAALLRIEAPRRWLALAPTSERQIDTSMEHGFSRNLTAFRLAQRWECAFIGRRNRRRG